MALSLVWGPFMDFSLLPRHFFDQRSYISLGGPEHSQPKHTACITIVNVLMQFLFLVLLQSHSCGF